nr:hypothetical protein CFP56_30978 [Quercus suber]
MPSLSRYRYSSMYYYTDLNFSRYLCSFNALSPWSFSPFSTCSDAQDQLQSTQKSSTGNKYHRTCSPWVDIYSSAQLTDNSADRSDVLVSGSLRRLTSNSLQWHHWLHFHSVLFRSQLHCSLAISSGRENQIHISDLSSRPASQRSSFEINHFHVPLLHHQSSQTRICPPPTPSCPLPVDIMAVVFTKRRLLVGYRARDWSPVWYEPIGQPDEDGNTMTGLFSLADGDAERREPMEGEVYYHAHFDPRRCESDIKKERTRMHQQTMYDAWTYMYEKDPNEVRRLEEEMHRPRFRRWQSWFEQAKKQKKITMRAAERRRRRNRTSNSKGKAEDDDSDVDSALGDESSGPTPGGPAPGGPGDVGGSGSDGRGFSTRPDSRRRQESDTTRRASEKSSSKRQRKGPFVLDGMDDDDDDDDVPLTNVTRPPISSGFPTMSGALAQSSTSGQSPIVIDDSDDDDESAAYDTRAPRDQNSDLISLSPEISDERTMPPPAKRSRYGSTVRQTKSPSRTSLHPYTGLPSGNTLRGLPTPRSQSASAWMSGTNNFFGDIKSTDGERALRDRVGHHNLFQRFNGIDDPDQAMQEAMQQSRESLARESIVPESMIMPTTETGNGNHSGSKDEAKHADGTGSDEEEDSDSDE